MKIIVSQTGETPNHAMIGVDWRPLALCGDKLGTELLHVRPGQQADVTCPDCLLELIQPGILALFEQDTATLAALHAIIRAVKL